MQGSWAALAGVSVMLISGVAASVRKAVQRRWRERVRFFDPLADAAWTPPAIRYWMRVVLIFKG